MAANQRHNDPEADRSSPICSLSAALLLALTWLATAHAAQVTDATGRTVTIPDSPQRVLPAGPPAQVLLAAIAPTEILGLPEPVGSDAKAALPSALANLPRVPRVTGAHDVSAEVKALHPDLIIDYGTVSPRYKKTAEDMQAKTGIPTLLFDGALDQVPTVARTLGTIMHQSERAAAVARFAEAILALSARAGSHPTVLYARGADGTLVAAPGTDVTALFTRLGWHVVAPEGTGAFRPTTVDGIKRLDPDVIFLADPAAKSVLTDPAWAGMKAVRDGHVYIAPSIPFGWIEAPPSINRLIGLAWLQGADPRTLAAVANADLYDRVLTTQQIEAIAGTTSTIRP